jgi:hypothetical protein
MAMNIPMPDLPGNAFLKGLDSGSSMFSRMMQPEIQRQQMGQQWQQHLDNLGIQQQAQSRLQKQFEQEQQDRAMLQQLMDGGGQSMGQPGQQQMPTQEYGQGMGMFTPEGLQNAQQQAQQVQAQRGQPGGAVNLEALRNSPIGRGLFKKFYGVDPVAEIPQTPKQKQAAELELFKKKEQYKAQSGGDKNTNQVITKAQNTVGGVVNALPIIDDLIKDVGAGNVPGTILGGTFKRDQQANYASNISESAETLANALGYPNTEGGFHQAEKVVARDFGESDENYKKRLIKLKEKLKKRSQNAQGILGKRSSNSSNDGSKVINGVTYHPDGQGGWEHD